MRSALTVDGMTEGTSLSKRSNCNPTASIDERSAPFTLIPNGARIPLCNMMIRAAIGCSLGAEVEPGIWPAREISAQMSSAERTPRQAARPGLSAGSNAGRHRRKGRPFASGIKSPAASRA